VRLAFSEIDSDDDHRLTNIANDHRMFDRHTIVHIEIERWILSTNLREFIFFVRHLFYLFPIIRSLFLRRVFEKRKSIPATSKEIPRTSSSRQWENRERRRDDDQKWKESAIVRFIWYDFFSFFHIFGDNFIFVFANEKAGFFVVFRLLICSFFWIYWLLLIDLFFELG